MPRHGFALALVLTLGATLGGCRGAGRFLGELLRERPPAPLDSMSVASDARIDSTGHLVGSFVGEGTSRAVHLLSSDTAFIGELIRRYRPELRSGSNPWTELARRRVVTLAEAAGQESGRRRTTNRGPLVAAAVVGSPLGHTEVTLAAVVLRGGDCGPRGAQAELVVEDERLRGDPPLRGPVLGSFRQPGETAGRDRGMVRRDPAPPPSLELIDELVGRTGRTLDSALDASYRSLELRAMPDERLELNTLADVDAADVIAFRASEETVRYAVSLRARRLTARGDTLVAAAVMVWDRTGAWQQWIFRPTLLALRRGRLSPYGSLRRTVYWRRLQPISDFAFPRDNLWMEQVDVRDGTVLWGIVQPRGNVVVAAAEVGGPCR
jgi:hypothetical protein